MVGITTNCLGSFKLKKMKYMNDNELMCNVVVVVVMVVNIFLLAHPHAEVRPTETQTFVGI